MTDKTVLITGGTRGLGLQTAISAVRDYKAARVIITGRNESEVASVAEKINRELGVDSCRGVALDLSSCDDIARFAKKIKEDNSIRLDALICNAGLQIVNSTAVTRDGFEKTFGVNHLGHFLLSNLLLEHMSENARIIFVASDTHDPAKRTGMPAPQIKDITSLATPLPENSKRDLGELGRVRYTTSKLCNILCTYEFASRLEAQQSPICVNAFNPGLMLDTALVRDYSYTQLLKMTARNLRYFLPQMLRNNSSKKMGRALARFALHTEYAGMTASYFDRIKIAPSSAESRDPKLAAALWQHSSALCAPWMSSTGAEGVIRDAAA